MARAVGPTPAWRLLVGEAAAANAFLARSTRTQALVVHDQRYLAVDADAVPDVHAVADPGVRRAVEADVDTLAELAVRLHVDDGFGADPGEAGRRGYRARLAVSVRSGTVDVVGPVGRPVAKLERSVDHPRYGVQLAGIVVAPELRGQGVGRGLVAVVTRRAIEGRRRQGAPAPAVTLHTRTANGAAIRAYEASGFRILEPWRLAVA
jgi:ribosomal protein S18 acetylase RimI-like enzyme